MEDKYKIKTEFKKLYNDIDECITSLIRGRKLHDGAAVAKAYQRMETLMVATQQDISWLIENVSEWPIPEGLEEAAKSKMKKIGSHTTLYEGTIDELEVYEPDDMIRMANFGAHWQKQQMMKQAVGAKACAVYPLKTCNEVHYSVQYPIGVLPQKDGDKVKVIIIKEG